MSEDPTVVGGWCGDISCERCYGSVAQAQARISELEHDRAELIEALREYQDAEWMVTHDWGGDRKAILDRVDALLARLKVQP